MDNINFYVRPQFETAFSKPVMLNKTAYTLVVTEDVPFAENPANLYPNVEERIWHPIALQPTSEFYQSIYTDLLHLIKTIVARYLKVQTRFERGHRSIDPEQLELKKTTFIPGKTIDKDESKNADVFEILDQLLADIGVSTEDLHGRSIIIAGDQMTVDRIRHCKHTKKMGETGHHGAKGSAEEWKATLDCFETVNGFFHVHMKTELCAWQSNFASMQDTGSIAHYSMLHQLHNVSIDTKEFYTIRNIIQNMGEAHVLATLCAKLGLKDPANKCMKSNAEVYKACEELAKDIMPSFWTASSENLKHEHYRKPTSSEIFIRDALFSQLFNTAIHNGEIGKVLDMSKYFTTCLYGYDGSHYYRNAMTDLQVSMEFLWTPKFRELAKKSLLVNPTGRPGGWMPIDQFQEHMQRLEKAFAASNAASYGTYTDDVVSPIKDVLSTQMNDLCKELGGSENKTHHTKPDNKTQVLITVRALMKCIRRTRKRKARELSPDNTAASNSKGEFGRDAYAIGMLNMFTKGIDDYSIFCMSGRLIKSLIKGLTEYWQKRYKHWERSKPDQDMDLDTRDPNEIEGDAVLSA